MINIILFSSPTTVFTNTASNVHSRLYLNNIINPLRSDSFKKRKRRIWEKSVSQSENTEAMEKETFS